MDVVWKPFVSRGALLVGANKVVATWQGKRPIKGQWLLQYWGNPMATWPSKRFRPAPGSEQLLVCEDNAAVKRAYAAIVTGVGMKFPRVRIDGPPPMERDLIAQLAAKRATFYGPTGHSMILALHRLTHALRAEAALQSSRDEQRTVVFETGNGAAVVSDLSGPGYAAVNGNELLVVTCSKRNAKTILPLALAGQGFREKRIGTVALDGNLAIGTVTHAFKVVAELPARRGKYQVFVGKSDDASYLSLRNP